MNNYSKQESEKAMSEMRDSDYAIPDFIAKVRPKNFEDILGSSVSASYVDKIMGRFLREFNSKFVPELNDVLKNNKERVNLWTDGIDQVEGLVNNNWKDIKILKENFNILREEVEKLKSAAVDTNEWEAPANLDMF